MKNSELVGVLMILIGVSILVGCITYWVIPDFLELSTSVKFLYVGFISFVIGVALVTRSSEPPQNEL